jgi:RES domain-containing protein
MIVYRLSKRKYADDLSGKGAEVAGGRWNSKGNPMFYTSESRSLCTTEIAVHTPLGIMPVDFFLVSIEIPDDLAISEIKISELPMDWRSLPHAHSTQVIGDHFLKEAKYAVMRVPSAVVQGDSNYLLNPAHKDFTKIRIMGTEPFGFDERLFK